MVGSRLFAKAPHFYVPFMPLTADVSSPPQVAGATATGGRLPIIALLDSAVDTQHPWFKAGTLYQLPGIGDQPEPTDLDPGLSIEYTQHGTFNAGLLRQFAPNAQILPITVMRCAAPAVSGKRPEPGLIASEDVQNALIQIREQNALRSAQDGFIDVVCLPFGYQNREVTSYDYADWFAEKQLLNDLATQGVLVVAAAGNYGTKNSPNLPKDEPIKPDEPVYPAAFSDTPTPVGPAVLSVGALGDDGKVPAPYSSSGTWVKYWEPGYAVSILGGHDPAGSLRFASSKGTSFAAAKAAAKLASSLAADPTVGDVSQQATIDRAKKARADLIETK